MIYLDFNRITCVFGVLKRVITNYGKVRPDMGPGCPERFDPAFLKWVWRYNVDVRQENLQLFEEFPHVKRFILKNRHQVKNFLREL